jgi:hypothetical protein
MTAGRGDRAAPPAPTGHWEVRFADAASAKGWESLAQQARENTYRAWVTMRTAPGPATETPGITDSRAAWPTAPTADRPANSGRSR